MAFRPIFRFAIVIIANLLLSLAVWYLELLDSARPVSVKQAINVCVKASLRVAKGPSSPGIPNPTQPSAADPATFASPTHQYITGGTEDPLLPVGVFVVAVTGSLATIFDPTIADRVIGVVVFLVSLGLLALVEFLASLVISIIVRFRRTVVALARFLHLSAPAGDGVHRQRSLSPEGSPVGPSLKQD